MNADEITAKILAAAEKELAEKGPEFVGMTFGPAIQVLVKNIVLAVREEAQP